MAILQSGDSDNIVTYLDIAPSKLLNHIRDEGYFSGSPNCTYLRNSHFYKAIREGWLGKDGSFIDYFQRRPPNLISWGQKHLGSSNSEYLTISLYLPNVNPIHEIWKTLNSGTYGYGTHWNMDTTHGIVKPYVWRESNKDIGITYSNGSRVVEIDTRNFIVLPHTLGMHAYSQPSGTALGVTGLTAVYTVGANENLNWEYPVTAENLFNDFRHHLGSTLS